MLKKSQKYVLPTLNAVAGIEDPGATRNSNFKRFRKQLFASAVACIGGFSMGTVGGYTSPAMEGIQRDLNLNEQEVSLVISVAMLASLPGGFAGGAVSDYFGRKLSLMIVCAIYAIGWFLLVCAPNVLTVYAGRVITGLAQGMASTCAPVYVTEVASPEVRGVLGTCFQFSVALGILYTYAVGTFVSWNYLALACLVISAIQAPLLLILPETPLWLTRHRSHEDAAASLGWLRRSDMIVTTASHNDQTPTTYTERLTLRSLRDPALIRPLLIVFIQIFVEQCSGVTVVVVSSAAIFQTAGVSLDANVCSIIVAGSMLAAVLAAFVLVEKLGRRILLIVSGFFMAAGMISLGTYYYLRANDVTSVNSVLWLPVLSIVTYMFAFGIGFGPVPSVMMGELFPLKARGLASGVIMTLKWTLAFITAKTYVDMQHAINDYGVFWLFGGVCVFGVVFSCFFVPETKGKTLDEIESIFKGQSKQATVPSTMATADTLF